MNGGTLIYNGIRLDYTRITSLVQTPVLDPSGTDTMYYVAKLTAEGYFYLSSKSWASINPEAFGDVPDDAPPATIGQIVRSALMAKAQAFSYSNSDVEYLVSTPADQVGKGPKPLSVAFDKLLEGSWHVSLEIEVSFLETTLSADDVDASQGTATFGDSAVARQQSADDPAQRPTAKFNPIGSLRWESKHHICQLGYSTIEYTGKLILRCPVTAGHPDEFRGLVTPPIFSGFCREKASYSINSDGSECSFSFIDVEAHQMPPETATKWSGEMRLSFQKYGSITTGTVSIHLEGGRNVRKSDLVREAVAMAFETLKARGLRTRPASTTQGQTGFQIGWRQARSVAINGIAGGPALLQAIAALPNADGSLPSGPANTYDVTGGEIRDSLHLNQCDVVLSGYMQRIKSITNGLPLDFNQFDTVIPSLEGANDRGIAPPLFGNVPTIKLFAALLGGPEIGRDFAGPDANLNDPAVLSPNEDRNVQGPTPIQIQFGPAGTPPNGGLIP